uniref:Uncharacterized protein n=1 Tax=Candidatus Kentrum sp. DK TaxID=2126562 RepID=A0A450SAV9_9GAMM|nr:MAG: hypothetical protein BECKDK2373B_GA0170837_10236 [Candidatus Kentron sp. DK]
MDYRFPDVHGEKTRLADLSTLFPDEPFSLVPKLPLPNHARPSGDSDDPKFPGGGRDQYSKSIGFPVIDDIPNVVGDHERDAGEGAWNKMGPESAANCPAGILFNFRKSKVSGFLRGASKKAAAGSAARKKRLFCPPRASCSGVFSNSLLKNNTTGLYAKVASHSLTALKTSSKCSFIPYKLRFLVSFRLVMKHDPTFA